MSKHMRKRVGLSIIIGIISLVLFGVFLVKVQTNLSVKNQQGDTKIKLEQMDEVIKAAEDSATQTTETFDDIYISKVESAAYIAKKQQGFEYTTETIKKLRDELFVTNLLILDKQGNQIGAADESVNDFTYDRFNQLRTVFAEAGASKPFEVKTGEDSRRYYGAAIDANTMVVVEQATEKRDVLLDMTSTWKEILGNVSVGLDGFAFAVSSKDYTFLYYPEEEMIGKDALSAGIDTLSLEDDNYTWMEVNGQRLYCGISKIDDTYIICAVTEDEIAASRNITVAVVLFIFFAVLTLVILYAVLSIKDDIKYGNTSTERYSKAGHWVFDRVLGRKVGTVAIIGLVMVLGVSFYMQTLFSLSRQSMSGEQHVKEVQKVIDAGDQTVGIITEQYNERYLNKCKLAAYILSTSPELRTKEELRAISNILHVDDIDVFNSNGERIESSGSFTNFKISTDPKAQSYEFNKLLNGAEHVIQKAQKDETSEEYRQYIGVVLSDANGDADGFVQIAVEPSKLKDALETTSLSATLQSVKVGAKGFAFAVNKKDKTFAYYPHEKMIGRKATNYGMEANQFRDEYSDYITIGKDKYFGSSLETDSYYIYTVVPVKEMTNNRGDIALFSTLAALICLAVIFILLTFTKKGEEQKVHHTDEDGPMIDIVMPDGSIRKTQTAASRWANISIGWDDKTPEQQLFSVLQWIFGILAIAIGVAVIFKDSMMHANSIFLYVLQGKWVRGLNIFAITASLMLICVVSMVTMILKKILRTLSRTFGARGETLCRLLGSFVKYASVIVMLYYCLALVGVDTKTLLASAGILTLVVGLGAKTLVEDILAGLFIIFEGEFRVGDIVTIGDCRGTVVEIGIRTTKIQDPSQNVKVISNSQVSGVVNMTKFHSYASADVGIEYGESLERVENILERELPNIKRRVPSIQDGPFYKGVVELAESSVVIRIVAQCAETDRIQLGRDLNRELKILCDNNDINIPFPQVVLNQPVEFEEATDYEKRRADAFHKKQAELSKDLKDETEK